MKETKLDCIEQFRTDFIGQLIDYKKKNNLDHEGLAKKIGCNGSYVSILMGRTRPLKIETMVKILVTLGLDVRMKIVNPKRGRRKLTRA